MVLAMFAGDEEGGHYTDDEIRELVTLIWEWQWGVGRSILASFRATRRPLMTNPQGSRPPNSLPSGHLEFMRAALIALFTE
jgi:hypothetical protein